MQTIFTGSTATAVAPKATVSSKAEASSEIFAASKATTVTPKTIISLKARASSETNTITAVFLVTGVFLVMRARGGCRLFG